MMRAERLARNPKGWPLRWRLAAVSAGLTMAILVVFAVIIGRLAQDRIQDDFDKELQYSAGQIATQIEIESATGGALRLHAADLEQMAMADAAVIRVLGPAGQVEVGSTGTHPPLGPPEPGITEAGDLAVATAPVITSSIGEPQRFVQYARDTEELDATISRLWFFLAAGVLAGTGLAALAGFVVAGRAMRPISDLTATAREIAATRDPSRRMPQPDTGDEVAELAKTLEEMLEGLEASREEREQVMQAQRDFVADASHELRTPLTSILANLELLEASLERERGSPDDDDAATVTSALRSSRRMSRLVSDLLLLARADAGRSAPRRDCDLAELTGNAVEEIRPIAGEREIVVRSAGEVSVAGNPDELHRMISNLLDNAVRHTPDGSRIEISVAAEGDLARIVVSDDGPGLPEGMGRQVFERFVRGSGPADRSPDGGTGLGLAIVRAVAASHGGSVEAGRSSAGGARFEIAVPILGRVVAEPGRVETRR